MFPHLAHHIGVHSEFVRMKIPALMLIAVAAGRVEWQDGELSPRESLDDINRDSPDLTTGNVWRPDLATD